MSAEYDDLLRAQLKQTWTSEHEARLKAIFEREPGVRAQWEEDLKLERCLQQLPNAPVSSNFTALVLNSLAVREPSSRHIGPKLGWGLRWAFAPAAALVIALVAYQQVRAVSRHELAQGISTVSDVAVLLAPKPVTDSKGQTTELPPMPGLDILQDFNAISRLNTMPQAMDLDLLLALQ